MAERANFCPFCGETISLWHGYYINECEKCKAVFIIEETVESERVVDE